MLFLALKRNFRSVSNLYNLAVGDAFNATILQTLNHCRTSRQWRTFHTLQTVAGGLTESVGLDSRRCGFLETTLCQTDPTVPAASSHLGCRTYSQWYLWSRTCNTNTNKHHSICVTTWVIIIILIIMKHLYSTIESGDTEELVLVLLCAATRKNCSNRQTVVSNSNRAKKTGNVISLLWNCIACICQPVLFHLYNCTGYLFTLDLPAN